MTQDSPDKLLDTKLADEEIILFTRGLTSHQPSMTEVPTASSYRIEVANDLVTRNITIYEHMHACSIHDERIARSDCSKIETCEVCVERFRNINYNPCHRSQKHVRIGSRWRI